MILHDRTIHIIIHIIIYIIIHITITKILGATLPPRTSRAWHSFTYNIYIYIYNPFFSTVRIYSAVIQCDALLHMHLDSPHALIPSVAGMYKRTLDAPIPRGIIYIYTPAPS